MNPSVTNIHQMYTLNTNKQRKKNRLPIDGSVQIRKTEKEDNVIWRLEFASCFLIGVINC